MKRLACETCGHRQFDFVEAYLIQCQACGNQYTTEKNLYNGKPKRQTSNQNIAIGHEAGTSFGSSAYFVSTNIYVGGVERMEIGG